MIDGINLKMSFCIDRIVLIDFLIDLLIDRIENAIHNIRDMTDLLVLHTCPILPSLFKRLLWENSTQSFFFVEASSQMANRVLQLVNDSFLDQYYQKALECIKKFRQESVKVYNYQAFLILLASSSFFISLVSQIICIRTRPAYFPG